MHTFILYKKRKGKKIDQVYVFCQADKRNDRVGQSSVHDVENM